MILGYRVSGYASIKDEIFIDLRAKKGQRISGTKYEDNYFLDKRVVKSAVFFWPKCRW